MGQIDRRILIAAAAAAVLVLAVVIVVLLIRRRRKARRAAYDSGMQGGEPQAGMDWDGEGAVAPQVWDDEKTISEYAQTGSTQPQTQNGAWMDSTVSIYEQGLAGGPAAQPGYSPQPGYGAGPAQGQSDDLESTANGIRPRTYTRVAEQPQEDSPVMDVDLEETIAPTQWRPKAQLVFTVEGDGETREQEVRFAESMEIGRDSHCALRLSQTFVSRRHLCVRRQAGRLTVENLSAERTAEYTLLDDRELGAQGVPLGDGDVLEIAGVRITVHVVRV